MYNNASYIKVRPNDVTTSYCFKLVITHDCYSLIETKWLFKVFEVVFRVVKINSFLSLSLSVCKNSMTLEMINPTSTVFQLLPFALKSLVWSLVKLLHENSSTGGEILLFTVFMKYSLKYLKLFVISRISSAILRNDMLIICFSQSNFWSSTYFFYC